MARPHPPSLVFQDNALLDPARAPTMLDQVRAHGGRGIQQDVIWGDVVRPGGGYDPTAIAKLMTEFRAANARGLRPQVRLMGTPQYKMNANPQIDSRLSAVHPNAGLMQMFARDMARAFGGQVSKYSIWNEPNVGSFLRPELNSGQQAMVAPGIYRQLYRAGRAGVKQSNRNAKVGFGELTSGSPQRNRGPASTVGFMNRVLAGGNPIITDYVAIHPYQWSDPSRQPRGMDPGFGGISNLGAVNDAITQAYRRGRLRTASGKRPGLFLSEFGYKHSAQRNPKVRAAWMQRALQEAARQGVSGVNLYQLAPSKKGDSWDSSIGDAQGRISPAMAMAIRRGRRPLAKASSTRKR